MDVTHSLHDAMLEWFCDDRDAVAFAEEMFDAAQKWDDVIDDGRIDLVNGLLSHLAFRVNYGPFFKRYEYLLRPALLMIYLNWRDANVLEKGDEADKEKAFMLRAGIYDMFVLMAWIIGGEDHSARVGPEIRRMYGERLADYLKEHAA